MELNFNAWTLVFLIAVGQGFFLASMLVIRNSKTQYILAALIGAFSLCLLYYVSFWTGLYLQLPAFLGALQGLTYVFGPLCYFYIQSDRKDTTFNIWHFLPFIFFVGVFVTMPYTNFAKYWSWQVVIQNLHLLFYTGAIFRFIASHQGKTNGAKRLYVWRRNVGAAFAGYSLSFLLYYLLVWTETLKIEYDYMISVASSFFIYFIGYHGFQQQEIFKMYESGKYDKSGLSKSAIQSIHKKLIAAMEGERPYLDSSLRLQDLALLLGMSQNQISQVINDCEGKNFADFINEYRVREAQRLLTLDSDLKIIEIAYHSGFNTKASFNLVFRKLTGVSPSYYRDKTHSLSEKGQIV